jgi:isoleucyl-tRNA synthetase
MLINFENEIINLWNSNYFIKNEIIYKNKWEFLDGPPFVNGNPHYGHLLVSSIKDTIARYMSQKGFEISYQIGFDCHGLPLEQEAEKKCGKISPNDDINKIKLFNNECRNIISNCSEEWFNLLGRLGRQFDKSQTYYTSDFSYMQSLWWGFKKLWDKKLIYCSKKVMPYSPLLQTPLSNFEANSNYQDRTDISVYVKFKIINSNEYLLIWTTTPWSLFANQGICVNPDLEYILIEYKNELLWVCDNFNKIKDYKILKKILGKELIGISYEPIFTLKKYSNICYKVYADLYVDNKTGSGLVHLAPLFGEDDMRVMKNNNYTDDLLPDYLIDNQIRFNIDFIVNNNNIINQFVMDTSTNIVIYLKNNNIALISEKIKHSYPYCWRTDYPLIYISVDAWFMNVTKIIPDLIENNNKIMWYPKHVGTERFANWIKDAKDWCLSRNRVWGTPIPIWINTKGDIICIGSVEELEKLTNKKINDLHIDNINELTFEINGEIYKRTFGVLDCWFESGMAGLSRYGYPECINKSYPVDFIAESLDQTRGWFYTLNVLSTALNNQPAFKKVIVSGLILAEDGKKMSKRLNNYTNPQILIDKYGVDILRLYLIGSPACHAESFCFKDSDLGDIMKKILLYYNAHLIFKDYLNYAKSLNNINIEESNNSTNNLDIWIINIYYNTCNKIYKCMENLELHLIPNIIYKYIDYICNYYIKLSRERMKSQVSNNDTIESLSTLYYILNKSNILLAPFIPHLSEYFNFILGHKISIHDHKINTNIYELNNYILNGFNSINEIIEEVRKLRLIIQKPLYYPIDYINIYIDNEDIYNYNNILCNELNIKKINIFNTNKLKRKYKPNKALLGLNYKKEAYKYIKLIEENNIDNIDKKYYTFELIPDEENNMIYSKFEYNINNNNFEGIVYLCTLLNKHNEQEAELNNIKRFINNFKKELNIKIYNKTKIIFENNIFWNQINKELLNIFKTKIIGEIIFIDKLENYINVDIHLINIKYNNLITFTNNIINYIIIY